MTSQCRTHAPVSGLKVSHLQPMSIVDIREISSLVDAAVIGATRESQTGYWCCQYFVIVRSVVFFATSAVYALYFKLLWLLYLAGSRALNDGRSDLCTPVYGLLFGSSLFAVVHTARSSSRARSRHRNSIRLPRLLGTRRRRNPELRLTERSNQIRVRPNPFGYDNLHQSSG